MGKRKSKGRMGSFHRLVLASAPSRLIARALGARKRPCAKLSLIAPCYNVEKYIDEFFASVFAQRMNPKYIEIIAVDDGSTDGTAARIRHWSEKFPNRIRYFHQPNQGLASARNKGLDLATGDWVTFCDPDDFMAPNYLEIVSDELSRKREQELSMVSCNVVFFRKTEQPKVTGHPLRYRFDKKRTTLPASDLRDHIQLATNSAWFRRDKIEQHQLRFDPRVAPTFEDGHFVGRYLILNPETEVVFLKEPIYYWRKRAEANSLVDTATKNKSWYLNQLRYGYLDLLARAKSINGYIPRFVQRTVLYDVFWRFRYLVDHPERARFLSDQEQNEFFELLRSIFSNIDVDTIEDFELAGISDGDKLGLLGLMKDQNNPSSIISVRQYDRHKGLVQFSYISSSRQNTASINVNDERAEHLFPSHRVARFLNHVYFIEHYFWVSVPNDSDRVTGHVDGNICALRAGKRDLATGTLTELEADLRPARVSEKALPEAMRDIRRRASEPEARKLYGNCWLLMDRDCKADDNAEHFYRYLLRIKKAGNAFFALRRDSPDWARLEAEGFRLIAFNSMEHYAAFINAALLISSHANGFVLAPLQQRHIRDLVRWRFVFLQHGVIIHDLSRWLNTKPIDLFVTTTRAEYASIAHEESDYKFSEKEVVLTGLPRHDRLQTLERKRRSILIMPTWREYLNIPDDGDPASRFLQSTYAVHWKSLLGSSQIKELSQQHGLDVVFCPHPNVTRHVDKFEVPAYITVCDALSIPSLQPLFAEAAVLITDYSSVSFDVAYLDKPVLYYQFDDGEIFAVGHIYDRGYFDYAADGLGPVCTTEANLLRQLRVTLSGQNLISTPPVGEKHLCYVTEDAVNAYTKHPRAE